MSEKKEKKRIGNGEEPECGTKSGVICSELFEKKYGLEQMKNLISSVIENAYSNPKRFKSFEVYIKDSSDALLFDDDFISNKANIFRRRILRSLRTTERQAEESDAKFVIARMDRYVQSNVIRFFKEFFSHRRANHECGTREGLPPCHEFFRQEYWERLPPPDENKSFGRLKVILFTLMKHDYFKYHEVFDTWRKAGGGFDDKIITNHCHGLFEYVVRELEKRERNFKNREEDFFVDHLDSYVKRIIANHLSKEINDPKLGVRAAKPLLVTRQELEYLRKQMDMPGLTIQALERLCNMPLSYDDETLLGRIRQVPGYEGTWFKMLRYHYTGQRSLYRHETFEARLSRVRHLIQPIPQRSSQSFQNKPPSDRFDGASADFDEKTGEPQSLDKMIKMPDEGGMGPNGGKDD